MEGHINHICIVGYSSLCKQTKKSAAAIVIVVCYSEPIFEPMMWHQVTFLNLYNEKENGSCWEEVLQRTIKEPLKFLRAHCHLRTRHHWEHGFEAEPLYNMKKHLTHIYCTFFDCTHSLNSNALSVDDLFRQSINRGRWLVNHEVLHRGGWGDETDSTHTSRLTDCTMPFDSRNNWSTFLFNRKAYLLGFLIFFNIIEKYLFTIFTSLRNWIDSFYCPLKSSLRQN